MYGTVLLQYYSMKFQNGLLPMSLFFTYFEGINLTHSTMHYTAFSTAYTYLE